MSKKIYVFFHCDIWKSYDSMRFIGAVDEDNYEKAYNKIKREQHYSKQDMEDYIFVKETELNDLDI